MDPHVLVEQASAGLPAPVWFIEFFKVLGFTLHMVPMNLWYAGLIVGLGLHLAGNEHGRRFAARLLQQMPVIVAIGVNLGVVPLLFVQVAYYKVFYPATILMAWYWMAVIGLLIPAYYGVYAYAWGLRDQEKTMTAWKKLAGWAATIAFIAIGFIFANAMSLLDHVERWPELWKDHSVAGAALGTALNVGDPTLWPRWLLMFGLALGTTAVWLLVDATWLAIGAGETYRQWAWSFARKLYTVSMIWTAATGSWYVFGTWSEGLRTPMFQSPLVILTILTAVAPGLPWILLMTADWCPAKHVTLAAAALAQFGVLAINATSRQVVQNLNLKSFLDVAAQPTDVQWSPLAMFLVAFVLGLGVVAWMIAKVVAATRKA